MRFRQIIRAKRKQTISLKLIEIITFFFEKKDRYRIMIFFRIVDKERIFSFYKR